MIILISAFIGNKACMVANILRQLFSDLVERYYIGIDRRHCFGSLMIILFSEIAVA